MHASSARHIALVTFGNLASPAVALVTAPLLAVGLGVVGRGELAAATAPLLLCVAALTLGIPEALTNLVARVQPTPRNSLWSAVALITLAGALGTIAIWLLAPLLAAGNDALTQMIQYCSVTLIPALWCGIPRGIARGLQRWNLVMLEQALASLIKLAAIATMYVTHSLTPLSAALTISLSLITGLLAYTPLMSVKRRISNAPAPPVRTVLTFAAGVWPGAVAGIVLSRLDQTLVLPLSSAAALGVYAVAASLSDAARMFNAAVRDVTFANQSASSSNRELARATRQSTIATLAIAIAVVALAFVLVVPIFGDDYVEVPTIVAVLLLGVVIGNPGSVTAAGLSARGRPLLRSLAITLGVGINIALLFALVPVLGALGAAIAAAIANAVTGQFVLLLAWRTIDLHPKETLTYHRGDLGLLYSSFKRIFRK